MPQNEKTLSFRHIERDKVESKHPYAFNCSFFVHQMNNEYQKVLFLSDVWSSLIKIEESRQCQTEASDFLI